MKNNKITGNKGEDFAVKYLENNKYKIIKRNFRTKRGEIDIIAFDTIKNELVFIEVKTRKNEKYGRPSEAVDLNKQSHIYHTAEYYIFINKLENTYIRIDVIEIYIYGDSYKLKHLKQII